MKTWLIVGISLMLCSATIQYTHKIQYTKSSTIGDWYGEVRIVKDFIADSLYINDFTLRYKSRERRIHDPSIWVGENFAPSDLRNIASMLNGFADIADSLGGIK